MFSFFETDLAVHSLCDHMDCMAPGSSVHGIFWAGNTGVDSHFLLQDLSDPGINCVSCISCAVCLVTPLYSTLCDPMDRTPLGSSVHGNSLGKNTGVGGHAFLQGIFPTQGSNPCLVHYRRILYHLSHQGSISRWILYHFHHLGSPRSGLGIFTAD